MSNLFLFSLFVLLAEFLEMEEYCNSPLNPLKWLEGGGFHEKHNN